MNTTISAADTVWVLISTALVFLMTPGLAFFYGGLVRRRNVLNTFMMSFVSIGIVGIVPRVLGDHLDVGARGGGLLQCRILLAMLAIRPSLGAEDIQQHHRCRERERKKETSHCSFLLSRPPRGATSILSACP